MRKIAKPLLDILLIVSLYFQCYLLLALAVNGYWDVPIWMVKPFFLHHTKSDVNLGIERFRVYPKKGIEMNDLRVYREGCVCPIFRVESVRIAFADDKFNFQKSAEGVLQGGTVYYPDPYIPENQSVRLVENFSFRFGLDRKELTVNSLRANISNLSVISTNSVTVPFDALKELKRKNLQNKVEDNPRDLDLFEELGILRLIHKYFADVDEASLRVRCYFDREKGLAGAFNLFSEGARLEDNITTQSLYLYGMLRYQDKFSYGDGVRGELESIRYGTKIRADGLSFLVKHEQSESFGVLPVEVVAHVNRVDYNGNSIDYAAARIFPADIGRGKLVLDVGLLGQSATVDASYDLNQKQAKIGIVGDFNPIDIATSGWLSLDPESLHTKIPGTPHVEAGLTISNWTDISDIRFSMVTGAVEIKGAPFDYARAIGTYADHTVTLSNFAATKPAYVLRGRLSQNFETTDYRFLLHGDVFPTDLNPMFHDWWSRLWTRFEFGQQPVSGDIDIWGAHNNRLKRFTYGRIAFQNVSYKGLPIERGKIRLSTISKYTHLADLEVYHPQGVARGDVKMIFERKGSEQVSERLNVFTDIPFHEIAKVIGDDMDVYVENTNPEAKPDIWVKGCLIHDDFPDFAYLENLNIKIHAETPVEFFGVTLDAVDAEILKRDKHITVSPVSFAFAKGQGTGEFHVDGKEPDRLLSFQVDIEGFDYHVAGTKLKSMSQSQPETAPKIANNAKADKPKKEREPSVANLTLEGSCPLGTWNGLKGTGKFELDDPLIHRVHVFGGFSKLMDNAELNLGSFSLKHATSPLRLEGKKIYFDDLELTGPSTRVKAKGVVNLDDKTLDFRLKTYPLGEVKFPIVAGVAFLLRPITSLFEVRATGPIDDPEWNMVLNPGGL